MLRDMKKKQELRYVTFRGREARIKLLLHEENMEHDLGLKQTTKGFWSKIFGLKRLGITYISHHLEISLAEDVSSDHNHVHLTL